jgi:hypothetical protein
MVVLRKRTEEAVEPLEAELLASIRSDTELREHRERLPWSTPHA